VLWNVHMYVVPHDMNRNVCAYYVHSFAYVDDNQMEYIHTVLKRFVWWTDRKFEFVYCCNCICRYGRQGMYVCWKDWKGAFSSLPIVCCVMRSLPIFK
jgi:hypothetical protein